MSGAEEAAAAATASSPDRAKIDRADLAALLDVLRLTESDILPEMSRRSKALLGLPRDGEEVVESGAGAKISG